MQAVSANAAWPLLLAQSEAIHRAASEHSVEVADLAGKMRSLSFCIAQTHARKSSQFHCGSSAKNAEATMCAYRRRRACWPLRRGSWQASSGKMYAAFHRSLDVEVPLAGTEES